MNTIVLIDSGNTRLKVGVIGGAAARLKREAIDVAATRLKAGAADASVERLKPAAIDATETRHRHDAFRANASEDIVAHALDNGDIQTLKDWLAALPNPPVIALATNVAGPARAAAIEAALAQVGCPIRWIVPQAQAYGLTSRYTVPEQLGADRWVSMLGVLNRREAVVPASGQYAGTASPPGSVRNKESTVIPAPFLLASFGTATTLDTVSGDGVFEGGLILPGPSMMRQSLASGTANLPLVQGAATTFPTDTQHAISSGVAAAQAGALLRQWLVGLQRYGVAPDIYASGGGWQEAEAEARRLLGDATAAMGCLPPTITMIENPVLYGLARIAAAIKPGSS